MSFLKWLASNPEDSEETQLDLLNSSKPIRERVDGRTVRKDFARSIDEAGGSEAAYGVSTERITRELFDCGSKEMYESTGGGITLPVRSISINKRGPWSKLAVA